MALTACLLALTASCGSRPKTFDVSTRAPRLIAHTAPRPAQMVPVAAASWALAVRADSQKRWLLKLAEAAARSSPPESRPVAVSAPSSGPVDWPCVAIAETGADWTMHGATYVTAYGVVREIVNDYASPEVAARVFAGTASPAEQTDIVARFAAENGTGGWGSLTKQKCGL